MFDDFKVNINNLNDEIYKIIAIFNIEIFKSKCPEELQDKIIKSLIEKLF